jgi:hypothetical protein
MKKKILLMLALGFVAATLMVSADTGGAQADKIKGKAKDLKKKVEGSKPASTNAPPQKPKPK